MLPLMYGCVAIVIGSVTLFRSVNRMLVGILGVAITSGLIVHVVPGPGFVVPAMFVMF